MRSAGGTLCQPLITWEERVIHNASVSNLISSSLRIRSASTCIANLQEQGHNICSNLSPQTQAPAYNWMRLAGEQKEDSSQCS